ncbi:hypothetical protein GW756_02205 [bacterium]|nr:hypothetical protein [bacterium]NCQ55606.1 hypothetical protein [Candidatus Parcubacteria bacterium]NCS67431.1 hypothetical protein [Candidatus Peregrinibacteria bacterium]NCS96157.1 hypothetical protein [bacterium]
MKFITHFQDLKNWEKPRVVYLDRSVDDAAEKQRGIESLLKQPLSFSLSDIPRLEKKIQQQDHKLNSVEQSQFLNLVNYQLARVENENDKSTHSRTLFGIFRSPSLAQFLSQSQRLKVESILNKERKELEKLGDNPVEKWDSKEAIRVARSYRFVRNRLNTANLRINPKIKNTGDNLKLYAARLIEKSELKPVDKLFFVELKHIFPSRNDWGNEAVYQTVFNQASEIEASLAQTLKSGGNIPADAYTYWDTLVPTDLDDTTSVMATWLKRSAQVESVQALLAKDAGGAEVADAQVPMLLSFEEYQFLQDFKKSTTEFNLDTNGETKKQLEAAKANQAKVQENFDKAQAATKADIEALKKAKPAELKSHPKLTSIQKNSFNNDWLNLEIKDSETDETSESENSELKAFKAWREATVKEISESNAEASKEALAEQQEAVDNANKSVKDLETELAELQKAMGIYDNPSKEADKALQSHKKYFNARLKAGRLLAVDLDLMAQLNQNDQPGLSDLISDGDPSKAHQVLGLITETRSLVEEALASELQINDLNNLSETELAKVDKFLSYEGVLQTISKIKTSGKESPLLKNFEQLDKAGVLDARQVINAVTLDVRRDIMQNIESEQTRNSENYNQFISHYSRQHHAINNTDQVSKMLNFSADIQKEKQEKVHDVYEHAYEKVSSLFAKAEEGALLEGLNKILRTGVSASSVLNQIQARLPEGGFIHSANKLQLSGYKSAIVNELKGKVTPENDDRNHLEQIAQDLLAKLDQMKAAEVAKEALKHGANQIEQTDEDNLGVSDRLELSRRTRLVQVEASNVGEEFQNHLDQIKLSISKGENPDYLVSSFLQNYDHHLKPRFNALRDAMVAECDLHFDGKRIKFTENLEREITQSLTHLDTGVEQLRKNHNDKERDLSNTDAGFKTLNALVNSKILPLFDLKNGTLAKAESYKLDSTLHNAAKTHQYVRDELGVLQPEGAEKAREKYKNQLSEYKATVSDYQSAWEGAKERLEKDLKKFNEEEFLYKHHLPKKQARKILSTNEARLQDANWMLDFFSGKDESPYKGGEASVFDKWLADYENPETQPKALKFMDNFKEFKNVLGPEQEDFAGETTGLLSFRRDYDNNKPTLWFKKRYKITVSWYSLRSIFMMGKQAWEFWSKRTERRNDRMASELGSKLFGESWLGREFARDSNEKQDQRVSDFKNVHKSSNYKQLFHIIESATNAQNDKDEVQAAVELVMEKGELRWDSPEFLGMLGRLQDTVTFNPEEDIKQYIENPAQLKQRIGMAVTEIWDRPTWLQWKEDLPSKYKSRVDSHNNDYREEVQKGSVDTYLGNVLEQWGSGAEMDTNFERSKFESYLRNAFDNGEMNGYPNGDRRWYYLIMGLTLKNAQGDTILSPDTLSRFGELQNKMPFMDAFDDGNSAKLNGRVVPDGTPGSHKNWTYEDFQAWAKYFEGIDPRTANSAANKKHTIQCVRTWLNETLLTTNDSQDRMGKVQLTGIDRDDAGILPLLVSSERLRDGILRYASGDKRPADDKYYVNLIGSFENNFNDSVAYMKRILTVEDKEAPGYEDRKKTQLLRFGEMMRSYFMISQVLAGNWDTGGSVGAVVLSQAEWNNNDCDAQYDRVTDSISQFLGGEEGSKVRFLKDKHIQKQKSGEYRKSNPDTEEAKAWNNANEIYEDKSKKFQNIDLIQSFIESQ